jgi:hypothetical protein
MLDTMWRIGHTVNAWGLPYYIDMEGITIDGILQIYNLLYIV